MDTLFETGLAATRWLRETFPSLQGFMSFISQIGVFEFYLVLVLLIYWNVNKHHGKRLAYLLALVGVFVNGLKHIFHGPRPYWLDDSLLLGETDGYGIPSGHVALATVAYLYLASWIRQRWMWVFATVMIILMGLSRIYLAQHFLHDVVAGLLLGLCVLGGYIAWRYYVANQFHELILGQRFWVTVSIPVLLAGIYTLVILLTGPPSTTVIWVAYIEATEIISFEDVVSVLSILLGLGMGFILEGSRVRFVVKAELWKKVVRYLIGTAVAFAIFFGLRIAFASIAPFGSSLWLVLPLRFVRFFIMALWSSFYAPMLFVKIGLATAEPEPPIKASINRLKPESIL